MALELASSIAGLIGLTGLFIQSASTLYTFCRAIPRVGAEVESVIEEVQRFENMLKSLKYVAEQSKSSAFSARASDVGESLDEEIIQCQKTMEVGLAAMRELQEQYGNKPSNVIKRLKAAADVDRFEKIRTRLASHRGQLVLLMELLGVDLNIAQTRGLLSAEKSIEEMRTEVLSSGTASTTRLADIEIGIRSLYTSIDTSQNTSTKVLDDTQLLRQQLKEVQLSHKSLQSFSSKQADQLDSIMVSMQQILKACAGPTPVCKSRKLVRYRRIASQAHVTEPSAYAQASLNRIVNTAVTLRYYLGQPRLQLVAIPDDAFDKANQMEKLYMIKYLQGLRILTWFLRADNLYTSRCYYWSSSSNLWMIWEANLSSRWTSESYFNFFICSINRLQRGHTTTTTATGQIIVDTLANMQHNFVKILGGYEAILNEDRGVNQICCHLSIRMMSEDTAVKWWMYALNSKKVEEILWIVVLRSPLNNL